jgi:hypothetical protein
MCDACEDWAAREPRAPALHPRLARRAREIERGMPGEPVAEAAWRIAFGEESGAVAWTDHLRILAALRAAERPAPFAGGRRGGRLGCDAAGGPPEGPGLLPPR